MNQQNVNGNFKRKIIFFGGVGGPKEFGGELTKNKEIIARLRELGANIQVLDSYKLRTHKGRLLATFLKLFWLLLTNPKATFIFSTSFGNIYPFFKVLHYIPLRRNIIYWVIGGIFSDRIENGEFAKKYLDKISLFFVEGLRMKEQVVRCGFNNVWYVPNFKKIGDLPKIEKFDDGKVHFLFLSRIMPEKGCRYIVESVRSLNAKGLSEKFVVDFFGNVDNAYKQEFEKDCADLENVSYKGGINLQDEKNYAVIAQYDYMLFPTYWYGEGFPGVVIDAYKAGLPIIGSDWNLNPEFIKDRKTGIIVPIHSAERLAEAMHQAIVGEYADLGLVDNCRKEVANYDTANVINANLLSIITNIKRGGVKRLTYKALKRNKYIYFTRYKLIDREYKQYKLAMKKSSVKSRSQIKEEMALCRNYWHCPPVQYVRYSLFEKKLSSDELLDYIPAFNFYNDFLANEQRGVDEDIYSNKWNLFYLFKNFDIPTPAVIALVRGGELFTEDGNKLSATAFANTLKSDKKYFFKPVDGAGGTGIEVLKEKDFNHIAEFISKLNRNAFYVVQEGIEQADYLSKINPSSVNTLRVITQYHGDAPEICACVMRIGRNGKDVDNSHQGGLSCNINLEDGTLNETVTAEHGGGTLYAHPDSEFVFKGAKLENWQEIKTAVLDYARKFPELKELGWDIALTEEGIMVIEMNLCYGIAHLQVSCGGMRRKLNVYPN